MEMDFCDSQAVSNLFDRLCVHWERDLAQQSIHTAPEPIVHCTYFPLFQEAQL